MRSVWDLYLDPGDARAVMDAVMLLERRRAVREPLPLEDADLLYQRLERVARFCAEDAVYWDREALDRAEAATVDGGRWGSAQVASAMSGVATELADASREIARTADAAARDLGVRLAAASPAPAVAADDTVERARALLERDTER